MEPHAFDVMASAETWEPEQDAMRPTSIFPPVTPPGMAYVPYQQWGEVYNAERGFGKGTMFPVLNMPFGKIGGDCTR